MTEELLSKRIYQIACGYEDANDCNNLRTDPAIKSACDRLPISGADLASQPTMTRLENSISRTDLYRMARALVDVFLDSYSKPHEAIVLNMDDTNDPDHGAGADEPVQHLLTMISTVFRRGFILYAEDTCRRESNSRV